VVFYFLFLRSSAILGAIECSSRSNTEVAVIAEAKFFFMQRLRSNNSTLIPLNLQIERTIQQRPRDNSDTKKEEFREEEEELKVEEPMA
jgi:hypothetical protein